jgi:hypothetical protein
MGHSIVLASNQPRMVGPAFPVTSTSSLLPATNAARFGGCWSLGAS